MVKQIPNEELELAMVELRSDYAQIVGAYSAAIREIHARLQTLDSEFSFRNRHNPIHHIETRIKTLPSIIKKLHSMGVPISIANAKKNLHDIAGVRVVCRYVDDIYRIANLLLSQDDVLLILEKNYIKNPKPNGYRSLHLVVEIPVFLSEGRIMVPVEIQIRTIAMDFWASLEHSLRYKAQGKVPDDISNELYQTAEDIAVLDQRMQHIHDKVEKLNQND